MVAEVLNLASFPKRTVSLALRGAFRTIRRIRLLRSAGMRFYRSDDQNPVDGLIDISVKAFEDRHDEIDRKLCEAFLSDLQGEFDARLTVFKRDTSALVLLKNANTPTVRTFLQRLASLARQSTSSGPLLIIAANPIEDQAEISNWRPDALEEASRKRWLERDDKRYYPVSVERQAGHRRRTGRRTDSRLSPRRRLRRLWNATRPTARVATALLLVAVLATLIVSGRYYFTHCAIGIESVDDECVGVSTGSFVFDPALRAVEDKIRQENENIRGKRAVTVAVLMPMTLGSANNLLSIEQVRAHLEGAYIAQLAANKDDSLAVNKDNLKVRLVLANEGSKEQAWETVIDRLRRMVGDAQPLVAVTGLGVSVRQTIDGARLLSGYGIPMVGSVLTADEINKRDAKIEGFTRVSPSNSAVVGALAERLARSPEPRKIMLVEDTNPEDFYTSGLAADFQTRLKAQWDAAGSRVMPYEGTPGSVGIATQFESIVGRLCGDNSPDTVFYAGRAALLPDFVSQLRHRGCGKGRPITVLTGSDAAELQVVLPKPAPSDAPTAVVYAALADPVALADRQSNPEWDQYERFRESFDANFAHDDLRNGWAIMAHDAVLTVVTAARKAIGQSKTVPPPGDVKSHLYLLNDESTQVKGAGGSFRIDTNGNAVGRRLAVMELGTDGVVRVLGVYNQ